MSVHDWDERYAAGLTWGGGAANVWVVRHAAHLTPGTALDLAAGDGRHAHWLADLGWRVVATDFSAQAAARGRDRTRATGRVAWLVSDATRPVLAPGSVDLAVVAYLQLPAEPLATAVRGAAAALRPGGTLILVGHDATNRTAGTGGPQDPAVLWTPGAVAAAASGAGLAVQLAEVAQRAVAGAERPALDTVVVATRPRSRPE